MNQTSIKKRDRSINNIDIVIQSYTIFTFRQTLKMIWRIISI